MKHTITLLILCALFQPGFAQVDLEQGVIARYSFTGNADDNSGNNNNGTVYGATLTEGESGFPNTAYHFNGTSDYIVVQDSPTLTAPFMSLCAVVRPEGFYAGACQGNVIFWKGENFTAGNYGLHFSDGAYDPNCNTAHTDLETFYPHFGNNYGGGQYTPYIALDRWYCLVATFDGESTKLYVDGELKNTMTATGPIASNTEPLVFGHNIWNDLYPYWFNGVMDDVTLYDRALNAAEAEAYCSKAVGVEELGAIPGLELNTVSSNGLYDVNLRDSYRNVNFTVYNYLGEQIVSKQVRSGGSNFQIDLSNCANGVYLLDLIADGKRATKKLVKQ